MKVLVQATRKDVYEAPVIPWNNGTYTPLANKKIMDLIDSKLSDENLVVKNENYKVAVNERGLIRGVIASYDITSGDGEFGRRIMFRNSYDKSMSFALVCGTVVWICTNGCVSGDYQYKRVHKGIIDEDSNSMERDVIENIDWGFKFLGKAFENNTRQLRELKQYQIGPDQTYRILGDLFFAQNVISIQQMSRVKKEMEINRNFRHFGDKDFTAYDLYNHITEALKYSHPTTYISDHIKTHKLFEDVFHV